MGYFLGQSKKGYNEYCTWWHRLDTDDEYTSDEIIMKRAPTGFFMAKEASPENLNDQVVGDSFIFDKSETTIKSPDDLTGMKEKDIVEYQGEKWFVSSIQSSKAKMQNTYFAPNSKCLHYWYISLRK